MKQRPCYVCDDCGRRRTYQVCYHCQRPLCGACNAHMEGQFFRVCTRCWRDYGAAHTPPPNDYSGAPPSWMNQPRYWDENGYAK